MTFDEFVAMRLNTLLRYAAVLTGDRDLAQDIVQDTLIRVHRRWSRIQGMDQPEAFVKRMVTSDYLSWRRRNGRRAALAATVAPRPGEPVTPDHANAVADRDEMRGRLAVLPPRQRAALVLRFYERLTDVEIAEVLGCSPGAVRTYHSRALASLRLEIGRGPLMEEVR